MGEQFFRGMAVVIENITGARIVKAACRVVLPLLILTACMVLLSQKLTIETVAALPAQLAAIPWWKWAVAALFTLVSFWAVGQYDGLAHKYLRTGLPDRQARLAGTIGIAVGQTLGFGLVTGAVARWRMLPALHLSDALRLSAFVSVSFVLAWVAVTSVVCLLLPAPGWSKWAGALGVVLACFAFLTMFWRPHMAFGRFIVSLPSWRLSGGILTWALLDTAMAAAALFVFLPAGSVPFASLFPVFLIAIGGALISNTPGGVGPFELILVTALPQIGPDSVLAAILAYRVVYYAFPATLAAFALCRPLRVLHSFRKHVDVSSYSAPRSEVAVVRQNGGAIEQHGECQLALWPTGQTLTLFADPVSGTTSHALSALVEAAQRQARLPALYKCGPKLAQAARKAGWQVLHIADDAVVHLHDYALEAPTRRTLRRKLRGAAKAGVRIQSGGPLPYAALAAVDVAWQDSHGSARGGSMGRYCPNYLADQWVGCAYVDDTLVGYVSAHRSRDEWCLDLMRQTPDAPGGTMHALVQAGIEAARAEGAKRFCFAATPACPNPASAFWRWVSMQVVTRSGGPGLRQFKSAFAPDWVPRYAAARSRVSLVIALADLTRAIIRPTPLTAPDTNRPHLNDENYELASRHVA